MSESLMMVTMASFGLVGLSIATFAALRGWQGWLEVRRLELAGAARPERRGGSRRADRDGGPQGASPQARIPCRVHRFVSQAVILARSG